MDISVVIPTLNAGPAFEGLLMNIKAQQFDGELEIIIVDSGSKDGTDGIAETTSGVRLLRIDDFTHGGSRNMGVKAAESPVVVLMTQDALPGNQYWLKNLLAPFEDEKVGATFSRQIPYQDANPMEKHLTSVTNK